MGLQKQSESHRSHMVECMTALEARKITLEIGSDFEEYANIVANERTAQKLGSPFDHTKQFMPPSRGFWVTGRNPEGKLMHTQAVRLLDLRAQNLASYMDRHYQEYPPGGADIDWNRSWYRAGPGAQRITGRVAYHGEMWVDGSCGAYRGGGLVDILARVAFLQIEKKWNADHVFGYMLRAVARGGLAEREGYLHIDPYCLSWQLKDREDPLDCNMVYMNREDLHYSIDVPLVSAA